MTMTTAQFRKMAMECEERRDWKCAAAYWDLAVSRYPKNSGQLAHRDKCLMRLRAANCRNFADNEGA